MRDSGLGIGNCQRRWGSKGPSGPRQALAGMQPLTPISDSWILSLSLPFFLKNIYMVNNNIYKQ